MIGRSLYMVNVVAGRYTPDSTVCMRDVCMFRTEAHPVMCYMVQGATCCVPVRF